MRLKSEGMVWVLIVGWLTTFIGQAGEADTTRPMELTLVVIRDHLEASSPPWPEAWRSEYLETIRATSNGCEELPDATRRLDLLERGFLSYWDGLEKDGDRALFEQQCAEIRWYVASLMALDFPSEEERQILPHQWEALCREMTDSLLMQFPFLDPNVVCRAEADYLDHCLSCTEAPLLPIFQRPFTADQVDRIRDGWHEMRYARVDLMRQLGGEDVFLASSSLAGTRPEHPYYQLAWKSLEQLENYVWTVVAHPPDDYLRAWHNYQDAQQRRRQRVSMVRTQETRLQQERSRQLLQTEYLSFLFAVVLESPRQFPSPPADGAPETSPSDAVSSPPKEVMPMR